MSVEAEAVALCTCGHYRREHSPMFTDLTGIPASLHNAESCSGNTWAYPDDAEGGEDGREVRCQCRHFYRSEDE